MGGYHSHLGLIMTVKECAAIAATPIGVTIDLGTFAQVDIGMEAVEAASRVRLHDELNCIHITLLNWDEACKKLILASYANMYMEALEDYVLGHAHVTLLDLLVYLRFTYDRIAPSPLADCYNKMTTPYENQDPIETSFHNLMLVRAIRKCWWPAILRSPV
jgi:hypothetical protein